MSSTKTRVNKISTVVIPVADVDGAVEFYTDKLGFNKRVDIPFGDNYRWVEVGPGDAITTIALAPPPEGQPAGGSQTGICLDTTDVDDAHAALKESGADVDDEVTRHGGPVPPMFWLRDPDGNSLIVVEPSS